MHHSIKTKIRDQFNRSADSYDQDCEIQNEICKQSINLLLKQQNQFKNIADLACGTGESTKQLIQSIYYEKCYAIDFAHKLLSIAKNKLIHNQKVNFVLGDLDNLLFELSHLDLIFCNMGLQWSDHLPSTIKLIRQYLTQNGIFAFSIPISGNFPEMKPSCKLPLACHEEIIEIVKSASFELTNWEIKTISILFSTQLDLIKSLKNVGANYNKSESQRQPGLGKMKTDHIFTDQNNRQLTYKIGIYIARKY